MTNYNPFISIFQELGIDVYNISHQYISGEKIVILHATPYTSDKENVVCPECGSISVKKMDIILEKLKVLLKVLSFDAQRFEVCLI